jgi:hypothetical protein
VYDETEAEHAARIATLPTEVKFQVVPTWTKISLDTINSALKTES